MIYRRFSWLVEGTPTWRIKKILLHCLDIRQHSSMNAQLFYKNVYFYHAATENLDFKNKEYIEKKIYEQRRMFVKNKHFEQYLQKRDILQLYRSFEKFQVTYTIVWGVRDSYNNVSMIRTRG